VPKISVIVTNFNGRQLLEKNLEKVILCSPQAGEVILADDASTDDSLSFVAELAQKYQKLKIITHRSNLGFGRNSNHAVKSAKGDLVVLLNSDIRPHPDYLLPAIRHFRQPDVFGVGFSEIHHPNWARIFWSGGYLQHEPGTDVSRPHISAWLSGGSSVVRRDLFLKLGGFDQVYAPFYYEDADLGLRAWKAGFRLFWDPQAVVDHRHEATISKFPRRFSDYVKERNRLLLVWRHITDPSLLRSHRWAVFSRIISGPNYLKIIFAARRQMNRYPLPSFPQKLTDLQVLQLFR